MEHIERIKNHLYGLSNIYCWEYKFIYRQNSTDSLRLRYQDKL